MSSLSSINTNLAHNVTSSNIQDLHEFNLSHLRESPTRNQHQLTSPNGIKKFVKALKKDFNAGEKFASITAVLETPKDLRAGEQGLTKQESYLSRAFSKESWSEWTHRKTALGRVVDAFESHAKTKNPLSLKMNTIIDAEEQAEQWKKALTATKKSRLDCAISLTAGASASILTRNPVPVVVGGLNCLDTVDAGIPKYQGQVVLKPNKSFYQEHTDLRKIYMHTDENADDLEVTIIQKAWYNVPETIVFHGPAIRDHHILGIRCDYTYTINIVNTGTRTGNMYLHIEAVDRSGICVIL